MFGIPGLEPGGQFNTLGEIMADKTIIKLKAVEGFCLGKGVDVYPGDVFEAEKTWADLYIKLGRAKLAPEKNPEKKEGK